MFVGQSAPYIFNLFTEALHWIVQRHIPMSLWHYLDYFLPIFQPSVPLQLVNAVIDWIKSLAEELGLSFKPKKTIWPTTCLEFLGLELDSIAMEACLPEDKLTYLCSCLMEWQACKHCTLKDIQELMVWLPAILLTSGPPQLDVHSQADKLLYDILLWILSKAHSQLWALRHPLVVYICTILEWHSNTRTPKVLAACVHGHKWHERPRWDIWQWVVLHKVPLLVPPQGHSIQRDICGVTSHPEMGTSMERMPRCISCGQLSSGLSLGIRDHTECTSDECVEVDHHASSMAGFLLYFFLDCLSW